VKSFKVRTRRQVFYDDKQGSDASPVILAQKKRKSNNERRRAKKRISLSVVLELGCAARLLARVARLGSDSETNPKERAGGNPRGRAATLQSRQG
jgi:hypothetical protein